MVLISTPFLFPMDVAFIMHTYSMLFRKQEFSILFKEIFRYIWKIYVYNSHPDYNAYEFILVIMH